MDIANDIKGTMLVCFVVPEPFLDNLCVFQLFQGIDHIDKSKAFTLQIPDAAMHLLTVLTNHAWRIITFRTRFVTLLKDLLRQIQNNRHRMYILFSGEVNDLFPCMLLKIGGVNHSQSHVI